MSLHLTLAKKVLAHAKDLLKHIFNEAGQDAKEMEKKFLEALKSHAEDELSSVEASAEGALQSGLQQWQKAPRPEDATSVHAPADMSWDDAAADDKEKEDEADKPADPTPSAKESDSSEEPKKDDAEADTAVSGPSTFAPADVPSHGDADQPKFEAPARVAPVDPSELPTEGAASVHGDALPSSGLQSQAAADSGEDKHAGSELDLKSDAANAEAPSEKAVSGQVADQEEPKPVDVAPAAPVGGQDETVAEDNKAAQSDVPALTGGLDAQKDEGKPAEEAAPAEETASADATEENTAPDADKKVESADKAN